MPKVLLALAIALQPVLTHAHNLGVCEARLRAQLLSPPPSDVASVIRNLRASIAYHAAYREKAEGAQAAVDQAVYKMARSLHMEFFGERANAAREIKSIMVKWISRAEKSTVILENTAQREKTFLSAWIEVARPDALGLNGIGDAYGRLIHAIDHTHSALLAAREMGDGASLHGARIAVAQFNNELPRLISDIQREAGSHFSLQSPLEAERDSVNVQLEFPDLISSFEEMREVAQAQLDLILLEKENLICTYRSLCLAGQKLERPLPAINQELSQDLKRLEELGQILEKGPSGAVWAGIAGLGVAAGLAIYAAMPATQPPKPQPLVPSYSYGFGYPWRALNQR